MQTPQVAAFIRNYGSAGEQGVERCLNSACARAGMKRNPVQLLKHDVLTLSAADLLSIAPRGFRFVSVDCGKTPELMNRIVEFLQDDRVCPLGTIFLFQDFFDWHAPWNLVAFWRLLQAENLSMFHGGPGVTPFAVKTAQRPVGTVCDSIQPGPLVGELWCTRFTAYECEQQALEGFRGFFNAVGLRDLALKVQCLKVGAMLRAGNLRDAENLIHQLTQSWPAGLQVAPLQNAYCRLQHLKTGRKDLSLCLPEKEFLPVAGVWQRTAQSVSRRARFLLPISFESVEWDGTSR